MQSVYKRRFDSGGMFRAEEGIDFIEGAKRPYRAYVSGSWGGGIQCYRLTEAEAMAELERLRIKLFGS